jgi:hypothetical protein
MHVQPGYSSVTPCQTDNNRHIVRKEVTPHNGLATGSSGSANVFHGALCYKSASRILSNPPKASPKGLRSHP